MGVWHYTVGQRLRSILDTQEISLATKGVPQGEKSVVWLTTSPQWESTANKARPGPNAAYQFEQTRECSLR